MKLTRTLEGVIATGTLCALANGREIGTMVVGQRDRDLYRGTVTGYQSTSQLYTVTWDNGTTLAYDEISLDILIANYENYLEQPYVWQGRYQFFAASSTNFVFDDGRILVAGSNDTSRTWPPCSECYLDEIRFPLKSLSISLIGFPGPASGYLNMNLLQVEDYQERTLLSFPQTFQPTAIIIPKEPPKSGSGNWYEGVPVADGWSCDYLEYQFTTDRPASSGVWVAKNVVMGNSQQQGYCPKSVYRPCADDEFCNMTNGELRCIPGRNPSNTIEDRLLAEFPCPNPPPSFSPSKDEVLVPLEDGIRFDQRRTFLQASSYKFVINDTSKENLTNIAFPSFPDGFSDLSTIDYEIFNIWKDSVTGIEKRLNMQFKRTRFSGVLGSDDGWRLDLVWVYDNLPDWTEWNSNPDANETGIFVPTEYSLFACESVEFLLESTYGYRGGSDGILRFENMLLGAFFEPGYNVCDLQIYHPCPVDEKCEARNGKISCIPTAAGVDVMVSQSSSSGVDSFPSNDPNRFDSWLQCVANKTTETSPPPGDSGASIRIPSVLLWGSVAYQIAMAF